MPDCKGCGNWFGSATDSDLCPICERVLERLNGYAAPVVQGHWIECSNELNKKCSECDKVNGTIYKHENYCPYCGAKMDEVIE